MKNKGLTVFTAGGAAYSLLELLWRRRTHYSMFLAGGTALCIIEFLRKKLDLFARKKLMQVLLGSVLITAIELIFGLIFNKKKNVWDYSAKPLNYKGQICFKYSALWGLVTVPAVMLCRRICGEK